MVIKQECRTLAAILLVLISLCSLKIAKAGLETEYREEISAFENAQSSMKVDALIQLIRIITDTYPAEAIAYAKNAKALLATATPEQRHKVAGVVCWSYYNLDEFETAKSICNQLLTDAGNTGDNNGQASAYNSLASIASAEGDDAEALRLYDRSIVLAENPMGRAAAHNNMGSTLKDRGAYEQAFEHFDLALRELQDPSISARDSCYYQIPAAFGISDINRRLGDLPSAVRHIKTALICGKTTGSFWDQVAALTALTNLLLDLGKLDEAETQSRRAITLAQSREEAVVSMASRARAAVLHRQGDLDNALVMAARAYEYSTDLPLEIIRVNATLVFAELLAEAGQHTEALRLLAIVEAEARALSRNDMLERILSVQPALYARSEQLEQAYLTQKEVLELSRTNLQQSTLRRMTLLQSQLDFGQQALAAKQAQDLQHAAEDEASRATFSRNAVLVGGLLLLVIGYLANSRRFQTRQAALNENAKKLLEDELRVQSEALLQQAEENLTLETQILNTQKLEAVGKLTGGIAHDFNNLMVIVMGAIELVRNSNKSQLDHSDRQLLVDASDAVSTGTDITQQLLAYARQQPLDPAPTEISSLLDSTASMLSHALGDRISLSRSQQNDAIWCEIDRSQLITALINLIINSRDATDGAGKVHLHCSKEYVDDSGPSLGPSEYCKLVVQDSGSGIAPDELDRVTEPFYTTKELGSGHGLGLSMVYGFVKQSKGELVIDSQLGEGTKVTIWLPLCEQPTETDEAKSALQVPHQERGKKTVLVVEDQQEVLKMAQMVLLKLGYEVRIANSGIEAKRMIEEGLQPDVVFSDVSMPGGLDGVQLAQWMEQNNCQIPVLLSSGYPHEQIAELGADFLAKPYRSSQLAAALERVLER